MKRLFTLLLGLFIIESSVALENLPINKVMMLEINSSINPATFNYLKTALDKVEDQQVDAFIIKLSTPGGLISTTKDILTLIGAQQRPVVVWVYPEGASATSAGAIISSGAHLLYMSEGTNIGAATPIQIGKDIPKDSRSKAINDLVALTQSLSEARGRSGQYFQEIVAKGSSFKAVEAKQKNLINGIASTQSQLFHLMQGQKVNIQGKSYQLELSPNPIVETYQMDYGQKILNIFSNPSLAYILFIIAAALIYFELQAPGGFVAGAIGVVCLILAGIGFQVLPLNFGALGLVVLAFILFIVEAFVTSYGLLTLSGLGSLILGSLFLYRSENGYIEMKTSIVASTVLGVATFIALIAFYWARDARRLHKPASFFSVVGKEGVILKIFEGRSLHGKQLYQIKSGGEIWKAISDDLLNENEKIKVVGQINDELVVQIKKLNS